MICWYCNQVFAGPLGSQCKMDGHKLNETIYFRKWQDPGCPALREYNESILEALKGAQNGQ